MGSSPKPATSGPPAYMQPYLESYLRESRRIYDEYTPQYYPGQTVAPQSDWTQQALGSLATYGQSPWNQQVLGAAAGSQGSLANAGNPNYNPVLAAGLNQLPQNLNYLSGVQQQGSLSVPQAPPTDIQNLSTQTTPNTGTALNNQLTQTPGFNPYIDQLVNRTLQANTRNFNQSVLPQIDNQSQAAGAYGGSRQGVAQGLSIEGLTRNNADIASQIYSNQYNQDLNRQLQAAGLGAQVAGQSSNAALAGRGQDQQYQLGLQGQGIAASQIGTNLLTSGYGTGVDAAGRNLLLAPQTQQLGQTGINNTLAAGGAQDQYQQQLIQSLMDRWNYGQNLPYEKLNQFGNAVVGTGQVGRVQTGGQPGGGGASGAFGGAVSGLGAWGALNAISPALISNPVGWGIMAAGALLGSGLFD